MVCIKIPEHLGIVPDGNRRFARRLLKNPEKGHEWGMKKLDKVMGWCRELGIKNVTFYVLSLENLDKRPKPELDFLISLATDEMDDIINNPGHWINKTKTRVTFFGHIHRLPDNLQKKIKKVRELTKNYKESTLNLAIAYGGRQEILDTVRRIASQVSEGNLSPGSIDEAVFRHNLYTDGMPDPDFIIRTGGEKRISNFLTFQSTYSELTFLDTLWPELEKDEFFSAVKEFGDRERRFGK